MPKKSNPWEVEVKGTVTTTKHFLTSLSIKVRTDQFRLFKAQLKPTKEIKVLDIGVTSDEILKDSNMFEKLYDYPENITAATIEDEKKLKKLYPKTKTVKIYPNERLPFKNQEFDIVVSWATLEHVGDYKKQENFINELSRVGKKIFITTPWRGCIYEPHTGFFFLHWLPLNWFRKICVLTGKEFWSTSENVNPLLLGDIKKMQLKKKINYKIYFTLRIIPSHIIIWTA